MAREPATLAFRAMNTNVTLQVVADGDAATEALTSAAWVFDRTERACTRFDPVSPLMQANAAPDEWHEVPPECFMAVQEAFRAHLLTGGLFDPRVLRALVDLGYDRTLPFGLGDVEIPDAREPSGLAAAPPGRTPTGGAAPRSWQPRFDGARNAVRLGPDPVDLGGIGKGLAVRWAARELARAGSVYLVDAGGDCRLGGGGPEGDGWRVGIEDPTGQPLPIAVLGLHDASVATSSTAARTWRAGGVRRHHVIDPRSGTSADSGLVSVTVVGDDPADAEVWSKALLITGPEAAHDLCTRHGLAALWVHGDGRVGTSAPIRPLLRWSRDPVDGGDGDDG